MENTRNALFETAPAPKAFFYLTIPSVLGKIVKFIYSFLIGLAVVLTLVLGISAPVLVGFFMDNQAIVSAGTQILRHQLAGIIFAAVILVSICVFQSTGKATSALILCVSRQGIIFTLVMLILHSVFGYTGVISTMPTADLLSAGVAVILLKKSIGNEIRRV